MAVSLFYGAYIINAKNIFSERMGSFFSKPAALFSGLLKAGKLNKENQALRLENESFRARIQGLENSSDIFKQNGKYFYRRTDVYSTYPFNNRRYLTINAGSEDGIKPLMPVAVSEGVVVGQVIEVSSKYSLVRTIFDAGWELPVRIGAAGAGGLLIGGQPPKITLIGKDKEIQVGQPVVSSGINFPYGFRFGELAEVNEDTGNLFKQGELKLPYNFNELQAVLVVTNFP